MYTTLAFLALLGAPYIYDISSLRVNTTAKFMTLSSVATTLIIILVKYIFRYAINEHEGQR